MDHKKVEPEKEWGRQALSSKSTLPPEMVNLNNYIPRQNLCSNLVDLFSE